MNSVVVVDDKDMMRDSIAATLRRAGMQVVTAASGTAALELIARDRPDAVVTDFKMPGMTGVELLEKIREIDTDLPVVLMTAFGTIGTAVEAMRLGAYDYITKPFEGDELLIAVKRAIQHGSVVRENALLRATAESIDGPRGGQDDRHCGLARLIGGSPAMRRVRQQAEAVAGSQGTVLISGESGSGKEVIARAIHETGPRAGAPFLAVNCAALSEALLESELFGHERGAFTGADRLRKGRFELAHGGTLLLDEVSEVSPQVQSKLLRVLQEREFERVGSSRTIGVDVRVIATSNRDLPQSVAEGSFRQDLFFRLNVLPIHMPAMRERLDDVPVLVEHFVNRIVAREGSPAIAIEPDAMELLCRYSWPGNVRELQNVCERAVVLLAARHRTGDASAIRIGRELVAPWLTMRSVSGSPSSGHSQHQTHANGGPGSYGKATAVSAFTNGMGHGLHGNGNGNGYANGNGNGHAYQPGSIGGGMVGSTAGANGGQVVQHGSGGGMYEAKPNGAGHTGHAGHSGHGTQGSGSNAGHLLTDESGRLIPLEQIEREAIIGALRRFNGHRQKTAKALGIGVRTLGLKLKKWKELELVEATL
jgi:two-component system, NtrC family, response regulator HydG